MIIAGFAGIGKTTFAKTHQNAIDLHIMPYKYSNLSEVGKKYSDEGIKAAPELILNTDWRYEYYDKLISLYTSKPDKIILIPSDFQILSWLETDKIPFTLVHPSYDLKEEYKNRFLERGNNDDFITVFIVDWDYWQGMFKLQKGCEKIELKSNEFLTDIITAKEKKSNV